MFAKVEVGILCNCFQLFMPTITNMLQRYSALSKLTFVKAYAYNSMLESPGDMKIFVSQNSLYSRDHIILPVSLMW